MIRWLDVKPLCEAGIERCLVLLLPLRVGPKRYARCDLVESIQSLAVRSGTISLDPAACIAALIHYPQDPRQSAGSIIPTSTLGEKAARMV